MVSDSAKESSKRSILSIDFGLKKIKERKKPGMNRT